MVTAAATYGTFLAGKAVVAQRRGLRTVPKLAEHLYPFQRHAVDVTIWKSPVVEMTRTKALGLLHKQLLKDSGRSRVGMPDYLLVFRKEGDNPNPIGHTAKDFPVSQWQEWASPVWMTVNQTRVLDVRDARDARDEKHLCPLQLDVIERALVLWSNPGDTVLSPFMGVGSEGVCALRQGRRFIGVELKESYFKQAAAALIGVDRQTSLSLGENAT